MAIQKIEEEILQQVQQLAAAQFQRMEKSQTYAGFSRNRVVQALPLSARATAFGASTSTLDEMEQSERDPKIVLGGKDYSLDEPEDINEMLVKSGSAKFLLSGLVGDYRCIIFGNGTTERRGDFKLTVLHTEDIRTPVAILPMAAVVSKGHITLREVAMDTIISEKWEQMVRYPTSEYGPTLPQQVRNALKKKTLEEYGIHHLTDFDAKRALLREELLETTIDHELAHAVILGKELTEEEAAISEAFSGEESTTLTLFNEFLAEFMPARGEFMGPLARMCRISKSGDIHKPTRLYYRYISDSFFYGNPDEAGLTGLTDSVVAEMSVYLKEDGSVLFNKLEGDLEKIYGEVLANLRELTEKIIQTIKGSLAFSTLSSEPGKDRTEFWWKVKNRIEKEFPELNTALKKILEEGKTKLFDQINNLRKISNRSPEPLIPLLAKVLSIPS